MKNNIWIILKKMNIYLMKYNFFNKSYSFSKKNSWKIRKIKNNSLYIKVLLLKIIVCLKSKISNNYRFKGQNKT